MKLSIEKYLKTNRRLLQLEHESCNFYRCILLGLNRYIKEYDEKISVVGIYTPDYRNSIVTLDKPYVVLDFSVMDLFVELTYIYNNSDWERYKYLYYTISQQPALEAGDIDRALQNLGFLQCG